MCNLLDSNFITHFIPKNIVTVLFWQYFSIYGEIKSRKRDPNPLCKNQQNEMRILNMALQYKMFRVWLFNFWI